MRRRNREARVEALGEPRAERANAAGRGHLALAERSVALHERAGGAELGRRAQPLGHRLEPVEQRVQDCARGSAFAAPKVGQLALHPRSGTPTTGSPRFASRRGLAELAGVVALPQPGDHERRAPRR